MTLRGPRARVPGSLLLGTLTALAVAPSSGCGAGPRPAVTVPEDTSGGAKCKVAASQQNPLVTEWPASEKANLEARLKEGGVVVAYAGCTMRLLTQCRVKGSYRWQKTSGGTDVIEIRDADELYAKLPLGAVTLEGELERTGRLAVQTTVAGQLKLEGLALADVPTTGDCAGATHVVSSLTVGAFKMKSGGSVKVGAGAGVVGGSTESEEMLLREAGRPDVCAQASEEAPAGECSSPIQMFLWPLPTAPGAAPEGPPGSIKAKFVSTEADVTWEVVADGKVLCSTPCTRYIEPGTAVLMRTGGYALDVPLLETADAPGVFVSVRPVMQSAAVAVPGALMAYLGGVGTLAGGLVSGMSCTAAPGSNNDIGCSPWLLATGGAALVMTAGILTLTLTANHIEVGPAVVGADRAPRVTVGPGFVTGAF